MAKGIHKSKRGTAAVIEDAIREGEERDEQDGVTEEDKTNPRFPFIKTGRPKAIQTVEELEERMLKYLNDLGRYGLPTKAGLCFALGIGRDALLRYEKDVVFRETINHYYQLFEDLWAQRLASANATGSIFYMKNAFRNDYKDRYETDDTSRVIHYIVPGAIAEKHKLPITQLSEEDYAISEQGDTPELQSAPVPEERSTPEQGSDGSVGAQTDGGAGLGAHLNQLAQEEGEVQG